MPTQLVSHVHFRAGVDPTPEQWQGILDAVRSRSLLPFFDSAYQASTPSCCIPFCIFAVGLYSLAVGLQPLPAALL